MDVKFFLEEQSLNNFPSGLGGCKGENQSFECCEYDIRLDSLLRGKASGIHHLESGMKNKVIMRKQRLVDRLKEEFLKKSKTN